MNSKQPAPARSLELTLLIVGVAALGFNLRGAITSLPPVFPELQARLHLSAAVVSVLAAAPVICFGVVSGFAAWFARRLGEELVLLIAVVVLAAGLLLRGLAPAVALFPGTILAAAAIAVMNVLLSSLIKRRWPERAGFLIGLYITFLSLGAITGSVVSVPLWNATGGSVPLVLGWLAVPAAITVIIWAPQAIHARAKGAPRRPDRGGRREERATDDDGRTAGPGAPEASAASRVSVFKHALTWHVTVFMGTQSLLYYAILSWLPTILRDRGASPAAAGNLLALMGVGNLAVSLIVPVLAQRMRTQHVLVVPTVVTIVGGLAGTVYAPLSSAPVWVLILGVGQNAALSLAIYFTMARAPHPSAAASLSALAQAAGYILASAGPLAVGLLHSATGSWTLPLTVLFALNVVLLAAGILAARDRVLPEDGAGPRRDPDAGTVTTGRSAR